MRELKFRAWVNDHWVDWIPTCKTLGAYNASVIDTDGYTFEEDNPFIVEQYTGLEDKNGKEIYEGDIVKWTNGLGETMLYEVYFNECRATFLLNPLVNGEMIEGMSDKKTPYIEVIGNIHENPELIGGENE